MENETDNNILQEIDQLVRSIVILTDTREQKNQHILDWLDKKKIPHKTKAQIYEETTTWQNYQKKKRKH